MASVRTCGCVAEVQVRDNSILVNDLDTFARFGDLNVQCLKGPAFWALHMAFNLKQTDENQRRRLGKGYGKAAHS